MKGERTMKKAILHTILLLITISVLASCGSKNPPLAKGQAGEQRNQTGSGSLAPETKAVIKIYFGNEEGDGLVEKEAAIVYRTEADKYLLALEQLKNTTQASDAIPLFSGFTFKSAELKGSDLHVDVSLDPNGQFGSNGETLVLQALEKTLFQFPEIQNVYMVKDGKKTDSLMGHQDLPYPMKRR